MRAQARMWTGPPTYLACWRRAVKGDEASIGAGLHGPRAGLIDGMGASAGKPKRARPSDFDVGRVPKGLSGHGKGAKDKGKGPLSLNRAKDKGPVCLVAKLDAFATLGGSRIFFFYAKALEGGIMAGHSELGMVVETAGNSTHSVPRSRRQG
ncbi:hypothetical protein COCNU_scaffold007819G000010 [Cocos nucifera]|nr:hypothetical protein [Cocos nucifera]